MESITINNKSIDEFLQAEKEKEKGQEIKQELKGKTGYIYRKSAKKAFVANYDTTPGFVKTYTDEERKQLMTERISMNRLPKEMTTKQVLFECLLHWEDIKKAMIRAGLEIEDNAKFTLPRLELYLYKRYDEKKDNRITHRNLSPLSSWLYRYLAPYGFIVRAKVAREGKTNSHFEYSINPEIRKYTKEQLWACVSNTPYYEFNVENLVDAFTPFSEDIKTKLKKIAPLPPAGRKNYNKSPKESPFMEDDTPPDPIDPKPDPVEKEVVIEQHPMTTIEPVRPVPAPTPPSPRIPTPTIPQAEVDVKCVPTETMLRELKARGYSFTLTF